MAITEKKLVTTIGHGNGRVIAIYEPAGCEDNDIKENFITTPHNYWQEICNRLKTVNLTHQIASYKVFNNKVVVAEFYDGTTEKAICDDEDSFSVETGLGICLLKHILGGSGTYNRLIQKTIKRHNEELEAEEKAKKEAEARKLATEKKKAKRAKKRKEKQIEMYKEALVRAEKEVEA